MSFAPIEIMNFISTAQIKLTDIFLTPFYRINEITQSSCLYSPIVDGLGQTEQSFEPKWTAQDDIGRSFQPECTVR